MYLNTWDIVPLFIFVCVKFEKNNYGFSLRINKECLSSVELKGQG